MTENSRETRAGRNEYLVEGSAARMRLLESVRLHEEQADGLSEHRSRHQRALFADPGLAVLDAPKEAFSNQDVQDLKRAVLQARRLREVGDSVGKPVSHHLSGLAVGLTLCLVFLLPTSLRKGPGSISMSPSESRTPPLVMTHSSVEALDRPDARVYELADEDFSLVLVVDESFEL